MKQIYLLTGRPGTGKTSLIKQAIVRTKGKAGGFYTEEIRNRGVREGFKLITLDGNEAILAHINIRSLYHVSKYGVDLDALEKVGVVALQRAAQRTDLIVIDEIGKMELFSANFRQTVLELIDGGKRILGTIMLNPNPFANAIKQKPQVNLITVTRDNHPEVLDELLKWLEVAERKK